MKSGEMNLGEKKKLVILIAVMVMLVGGASLLYAKLGDRVDMPGLVAQESVEEVSDVSGTSEENAEPQEPAPDFTVYDTEGQPHKLSDFRGKPVIVGSRPDERGVVCTCSYEARKFGVHSAMPSRTAYARCPHGIFVRPRMEIYQAVSRQIFEIFSQFTPYVEGVSVDEAYLDISGSHHLFGGKENLVRQLRRRIFELAGITASVGVANNRLLAKLGSEDAKPDGMTIMPEGREEIIAFLAPRALKDLWGVGKKTSELLSSFGFHTCADVQQCEVQALERVLGSRMARQIREYAFGIASDSV